MEDMEQKRGWFCGMIRASTKERLKKQRQQYGPLSATHKGDDKTAGSARARSAGRRPKEPMYCCQQSRIQMLATQQKREAKLKKQLLEEMADIPKATSQSEFNVVVGRAATAPATRKASGMETKRDRLQTRQGEETQMKPKKMARTQRPATAPQVQKSPPMARSKMYLRATAYASQRRLPGQTQGVVYRQANAIAGLSRPTTATSDHEIAGPVVFSSGNPMIRRDFVDQILSYDARRHAMIRQATNIPWPRPKAVDVSTKDAVLHPVYMHSSNKSEEYRDQLKTELAEQRLLRDHRERRKVPQPTPEYDSHGFPYYCTPGASRLGETNPHFEMCFLELVKNQRHPPPKRLVERPKIVAGVGAQSDAEKGHDPNWLTTRPFTAPPRRSLMNMPVTPRRDGSAPTRREPVRKEIPMPDNYKENYGRPTRSAFLRYQQSSLYRSHMALQGNDRLCVEMKKREAKVEAKRKTFSKKAMLAATLRLIRPPAHTHRTPDRETSSRSSTSEKSMTESKGEIESWSESRTKTESEIRSESRSESRAETEKRRSESSNRTKSESRSRKSSDEDIDEGTMDVVMSPRSLRRSFALGVRFNRQNFIDFKALTEFAVYIPRGQPLGTFSVNPASMKQSRRFANDHAKRFCAKDAWGRLRTITRVAMTFLRVRKSKWLLPSHGHPTADGSSTTSAGKASSVQRVVRSVVSPTSVDKPSADIPTEQPAASTTDIGHTPPSEFLRTIRLLSKALDISDVIYERDSIEEHPLLPQYASDHLAYLEKAGYAQLNVTLRGRPVSSVERLQRITRDVTGSSRSEHVTAEQITPSPSTAPEDGARYTKFKPEINIIIGDTKPLQPEIGKYADEEETEYDEGEIEENSEIEQENREVELEYSEFEQDYSDYGEEEVRVCVEEEYREEHDDENVRFPGTKCITCDDDDDEEEKEEEEEEPQTLIISREYKEPGDEDEKEDE